MHRMRLWGCVVIFLVLLLNPGPAVSASSEPAGGAGDRPLAQTPSPPSFNDYARFIAGLSQRTGGLAANEEEPAWINYARAMNQRWETFDQRRLKPMRDWAARELSAARTDTVFYPFSGPDFVNIYTLFPQARTYVMVALEPVGEIPDFEEVEEGPFFASLQASLHQYLYIDFFITAKMKTQLGGSQLQGVLPVLLFFLAREQAQVLDIRYCLLKPDGAVEERRARAGETSLLPDSIPGVHLTFTGPGSTEKQSLYYFQFNLQNGSLKRRPEFVSFLKSFGPLMTFTKAASYILSGANSSELRQIILDQSFTVLQDDSGLPLKYFDRGVWHLKFYGTYTGPINLFKNQHQPSLAEAFRRGEDVYPLPFGIGYHHRPGTSNLILAVKKSRPAAVPAKRPGI